MSNKAKSTAMMNDDGQALTPKLRFPEFCDQALRGVELKDVTAESTTRNGETLPATAVMGVSKVNGIVPMEERIISSDIARYKLVKSDWFAYNPMRLNIGSIARWQGKSDILVSPDYVVLRCLDEVDSGLHPAFLDQFRRSVVWENFVKQGGDGSVRVRIYYEDIGRLRLALPTMAEQQKIAACLTSVDELIVAQARQVDAIKTHRMGLMQQLFPREGETQPRLRFPEFQDAGEWAEGQMADIGIVFQGYGFPEKHQGLKSGDYPFYKVSDISKSLAVGKVLIEESANYVNESLLKELRAKPIPSGTTIFAKIGEAIRSNKRAITTVPCLIDNNAAGVKGIRGKATDFFVYLVMEQISLIEHAGGVVPAVNKSAIEAIPVKFPRIEEQQRIEDCLSSLDGLVSAETQKLDALKTHKSGLMQQLFPSMEEVEA